MSEKKPKRRKKKQPYFGPNEEEAVREYLKLGKVIEDPNSYSGYIWTGTTEEERLRDKIYLEHLKDPLNKMVESIIRTYKLYSKSMEYEDLHSDALSFLHIKFHKFKPSKEKKSYSYYGTVCKHYLLGKLIKDDKKLKIQTQYEEIAPKVEESEKFSYNNVENNDVELGDFIKKIAEKIKGEMSEKILNDNEVKVGNALVKILEGWENIFDNDNMTGKNKFNKNLILLYMRNMTSLSTKDIRNAMKRYKSIYEILKDENF